MSKLRKLRNTPRRVFAAAIGVLLILNIAVPVAVMAAKSNNANKRETVEISSATDWEALAKNCVLDTWSKNKDVVLKCDIDLSNTEFTPIPLFMGHFNGGGYRVFGLELNDNASTTGLFRQILAGGVVENVNVSGVITPGGTAQNIGGIVGKNNGSVKNCTFVGTVSGIRYVGGIAGFNGENGVIEECVANGTVEGDHCIGGIAGENDGALLQCINRAAVNTTYDQAASSDENTDISYSAANIISNTASTDDLVDIADLGGITGYSTGIVTHCTNAGDVGYPHVGYNIGGIVGHQFGLSDSCSNKGFIQGRKDVGGVVGQLEPEAKWNYDNSSLKQLKAMINELQTRMETFSNDLSAEQSAITADITKALNALEDTGDAVQSMIDEDEDDGETVGRVQTNAELKASIYSLKTELTAIQTNLDAQSSDDSSTNKALKEAKEAVKDMQGYLDELNEKSEVLQEDIDTTLTKISERAVPVQDTVDAIENKEEEADTIQAIDRVIKFPDTAKEQLQGKSHSGIDTDSAAKNEVLSSLSEVNAALKSATNKLSSGVATDDLQAVSDQLMAIMNFMVGMINDRSGVQEYVKDISTKSENHTTGTIRDCTNRGNVSADTNVGGIVGAVTIELAFDQEDELNISGLVSGKVNYVIYAAVRNCVNSSSVEAGKEASGGIAGRMDYGAAIDCESSGNVTAAGNYAGGIAGYCLSTVTQCYARENVSAANYAGGIAGLGTDITESLSMPSISTNVEFQGSIAGAADGELSKNYYAQSSIGGVDGFSFEGKAQSVSYDKLLELSKERQLFRIITVTFVVEDETVSTVTVPFGGSVSAWPDVPYKDGRYWKWDDFDNSAIYSSITVEGRYCSPIRSLGSGEEVPNFIVEGEFYDGQTLTILPYNADVSALDVTEEAILHQNTLSVSDYDSPLTVRMHEEEDGKLYVLSKYVLSKDGELTETTFTRDGSYVVFDLENGGSFVYVKSEKSLLPWLIGGSAGAAAIVSGTVIIVLLAKKRRKKKGADEPETTAQTDEQNQPVLEEAPVEENSTDLFLTKEETTIEEDATDEILPEEEAAVEEDFTDEEKAVDEEFFTEEETPTDADLEEELTFEEAILPETEEDSADEFMPEEEISPEIDSEGGFSFEDAWPTKEPTENNNTD